MASLTWTYTLLVLFVLHCVHSQDVDSESETTTAAVTERSCLETLRRGYIETNAPIGTNCSDLCTGPNGSQPDGIFAHPGDCRSYIQCTNWEAEARLCPSFQFFDTTLQACTLADADKEKRKEQCAARVFVPLTTPQTPDESSSDTPISADDDGTNVATLVDARIPPSGVRRRKVSPTAVTDFPGNNDTPSDMLDSSAPETTPESTESATNATVESTENATSVAPDTIESAANIVDIASPSAETVDLSTPTTAATTSGLSDSQNSNTLQTDLTDSIVPAPNVSAVTEDPGFRAPDVSLGKLDQYPTTTPKPLSAKPSSVIRGHYYLPGTLYRIKSRQPRPIKTIKTQ